MTNRLRRDDTNQFLERSILERNITDEISQLGSSQLSIPLLEMISTSSYRIWKPPQTRPDDRTVPNAYFLVQATTSADVSAIEPSLVEQSIFMRAKSNGKDFLPKSLIVVTTLVRLYSFNLCSLDPTSRSGASSSGIGTITALRT
jgi:hypothetical protein